MCVCVCVWCSSVQGYQQCRTFNNSGIGTTNYDYWLHILEHLNQLIVKHYLVLIHLLPTPYPYYGSNRQFQFHSEKEH
jgi:hypothetical protein